MPVVTSLIIMTTMHESLRRIWRTHDSLTLIYGSVDTEGCLAIVFIVADLKMRAEQLSKGIRFLIYVYDVHILMIIIRQRMTSSMTSSTQFSVQFLIDTILFYADFCVVFYQCSVDDVAAVKHKNSHE
jgi:hypothetical protein